MKTLLKHLGVNTDEFYTSSRDIFYLDMEEVAEDVKTLNKWVSSILPEGGLMSISVVQTVLLLNSRKEFRLRFINYTDGLIDVIEKYLLKDTIETLPNAPEKRKELTIDEVVTKLKRIYLDSASTCYKRMTNPGDTVSRLMSEFLKDPIKNMGPSKCIELLIIFVLVKMIVEKTFPYKLHLCKLF